MKNIDQKLAQAVVLLNRQYIMLEHQISYQSEILSSFENAIRCKEQSVKHVLCVYNHVFSLIDHLVRYQKISRALPRINQKDAEPRALNSAMGDLKEIRNQFQHINNDIDNDFSGPLLGAICWISNNEQYIASFHDVGRTRSTPMISMDTRTGIYAQEFSYIYNGQYYDLGKAIKGAEVFNEYIREKVRVEVDGKPYDHNQHFVAGLIAIKRKEDLNRRQRGQSRNIVIKRKNTKLRD